jgi:hypothetical protein
MGVRLDTTGRKAHQRILAAFKKLDPASVAVAVATGFPADKIKVQPKAKAKAKANGKIKARCEPCGGTGLLKPLMRVECPICGGTGVETAKGKKKGTQS